jgi:hypothetical protein
VIFMPGDPSECRQHALKCLQLATIAQKESDKERFAKLAATWQTLAEGLDHAQSLIENFPAKKAPDGS